MRINQVRPPRELTPVPSAPHVVLKDCGTIDLLPDEQVTLIANRGQYDVVRKAFGFFATPSLNHRLPKYGLRPALVECGDRRYIVLIEDQAEWDRYAAEFGYRVVEWL